MDNQYVSPLSNRYGSEAMRHVFSDGYKYTTWRSLWIYLAQAEHDLGVEAITQEQLDQMHDHRTTIDLDRAAELERETHHDVAAHVKLFGEQCPKAKPIIHLGATSCYITDNTEVMQMRDALWILVRKLKTLIASMCEMAEDFKDVATIGYTHFQPAQPTTVGKRVCLWANDLLMDYVDLVRCVECLEPLGCRGATGTSASFLELFNGDKDKVRQLEQAVVNKMGFGSQVPVCGQTYTRKQDVRVMNVLSGIAQSASKFATDIRLLSHTGEITEHFGEKQVGSSAMPYKHNPVTCENICSLSRYVICNAQNAAITASTQWLERSLDDSGNRRLMIPGTFIAVDSILDSYQKVVNGMVIHEEVIQSKLKDNLNMGAEQFIVIHVVNGGDRQDAHEKLRSGSTTPPRVEHSAWLTGTASEQVDDFINTARVTIYELPGQTP